MGNGWIGFDLDGTLAIYTHWQGINHIGDPIPNMVATVKRLLMQGQDVRIFTARACGNQPTEQREAAIKAVQAWCKKHIGQELIVTAEKDWDMIEFYDDRCVPVEYNTGRIKEMGA